VEFFNTLSPSVEVKSIGWVFWAGYYLTLLSFYYYAKRGEAEGDSKTL